MIAQRECLAICQRHVAGLGHVRDWIMEHFRIADRNHVRPIDARFDQARDAFKNFHQAALGGRVAVRPGREAIVVVAARSRSVRQATERELRVVWRVVHLIGRLQRSGIALAVHHVSGERDAGQRDHPHRAE